MRVKLWPRGCSEGLVAVNWLDGRLSQNTPPPGSRSPLPPSRLIETTFMSVSLVYHYIGFICRWPVYSFICIVFFFSFIDYPTCTGLLVMVLTGKNEVDLDFD